MHTCCLGVVQYCSGSCLWELFRELGGTRKKSTDACNRIVNMMNLSSKALNLPTPFDNLTVGMIRKENGKKPKFALKAAEGRHFVPVLHHMLSNFFDNQGEYKKQRLDCVGALKSIYDELQAWDDARSPLRLGELARCHLILYGELGKQQTDENMWSFAPKHHLFIHCAETARGNPKLEWCYTDEDTIGKCADLTTACNPLFVSSHLMERYRVTLE